MTTSKNFLMNKGMSYKVTAKSRGYYDYSTILNPDGTAISYDMTPYDGLNYNVDLTYNAYRDATIDFGKTKLPYLGLVNQSLQTSEYCLKTTGQNYDLAEYASVYTNITIHGNPTINDDVASNFSSGNYLTIEKRNGTMTINLKVSTGPNVNTYQQIFIIEKWVSLFITGNCFTCYNWGNSGNITLLSGISTNTEYVWKIVLNSDGSRVFSYSTDDGKNYTEAANFTDTGANWSDSQANTFYLGASKSTTVPFLGKIDLSKSSIFWEMTSGSTDLGTIITYNLNDASYVQAINAEYINNPEINYKSNTLNPNKQTSGNGYVKLHEFYFKNYTALGLFYTYFSNETSLSSKTVLYNIQNVCSFYLLGNSCYFSYKNTSNNWIDIKLYSNLKENANINIYLETSKNNKFKLIITNMTTYDFLYNNTITDANFSYNNPYDCAVGASYEGTNNSYSYCTLTFDGLADSIYKKYAGIYDPDYTDTGAAKTLNCFANGTENVVLSEKENYNNYTWLGTVNIPVHKVF